MTNAEKYFHEALPISRDATSLQRNQGTRRQDVDGATPSNKMKQEETKQ